ncbi:MAG: malonyl-ACP O-methyltransferase BioC [Gammaproteobacteria bacterium]|nr:malonyl-ACP O-methyltransferase BioC [Gammaproteobacteria bacterium]
MNKILLIDKTLVRRSFEKAALHYDEAAFLQREIADRLLERLNLMRFMPRRIVDVGAGTGYCARKLLQRYSKAGIVALDLAQAMLQVAKAELSWLSRLGSKLQYIVADAESLPLASASVDMIFSNLTLQWCNDLPGVFAEFERVLAPGGMLLFTTFGPDTLRELRESWRQVNGYSHVNGFFDMHDIGDLLLRARFAEPVMDVESLTVNYPEVIRLMRDIKQLGAHNVTAKRPRGLTGRRQLQQLQSNYEKFRKDGVLPATYEVIYGHAWKGRKP